MNIEKVQKPEYSKTSRLLIQFKIHGHVVQVVMFFVL
jgi:hypothetical protein